MNEPYSLTDHNGTVRWFLNGQMHRDDGPAVICANGNQLWYKFGEQHRIDGPAVVLANGDKAWFLEGRNVNPLEHFILREAYVLP
jgi:hypothetical protein